MGDAGNSMVEAEADEQDAVMVGRDLEDTADEAILACGGDMRETIKALILANGYLEDEMSKISYGYARGRYGRASA